MNWLDAASFIGLPAVMVLAMTLLKHVRWYLALRDSLLAASIMGIVLLVNVFVIGRLTLGVSDMAQGTGLGTILGYLFGWHRSAVTQRSQLDSLRSTQSTTPA